MSHLETSHRERFHLYTIHRILSLGLLIDFTFSYKKIDESGDYIGIELSLGEHGTMMFNVNIGSDYVKINDDGSKEVLKKFLENYDVELKQKNEGKRIF